MRHLPLPVALLEISISLYKVSGKRLLLELNLSKSSAYSEDYETEYGSFLFPFCFTIRKPSNNCKGSFRSGSQIFHICEILLNVKI